MNDQGRLLKTLCLLINSLHLKKCQDWAQDKTLYVYIYKPSTSNDRTIKKIKKTKSVLKWAKSGWTRISKYQMFKILLSKVLFNGHGDENHVSRCCCSWQLVRLSVTYASWIFLKKQLFLLIGLNVTELGRQYNKFYHNDRFCFKQYRYNFWYH